MKTDWIIRRCALLIATAATLIACASSPAPQAPRPADAPGDADRLLAAALRVWAVEKKPTEALSLAQRAASVAPQRPDVAWLHLQFCERVARCQTEPLESRLKKLAPDNAVVWLSALKRAQADKDAQAQILAAMERAQRFTSYWTTLASCLTTALHASTPSRTDPQASAPLTAALTETTQWLSALTLSSFSPMSAACSAERVRDPARRSACERIAQLLQRADSYAAEGLGLGIAQRLAAPGSEAAKDVERRVEALAYLNRTAAAVVEAQIERDKFSAEMLDLMKALPREQDVSLAILRWAGQPLTP